MIRLSWIYSSQRLNLKSEQSEQTKRWTHLVAKRIMKVYWISQRCIHFREVLLGSKLLHYGLSMSARIFSLLGALVFTRKILISQSFEA